MIRSVKRFLEEEVKPKQEKVSRETRDPEGGPRFQRKSATLKEVHNSGGRVHIWRMVATPKDIGDPEYIFPSYFA